MQSYFTWRYTHLEIYKRLTVRKMFCTAQKLRPWVKTAKKYNIEIRRPIPDRLLPRELMILNTEFYIQP